MKWSILTLDSVLAMVLLHTHCWLVRASALHTVTDAFDAAPSVGRWPAYSIAFLIDWSNLNDLPETKRKKMNKN